jgi:acyl-CoA synthetase (AMP-forming)/AMP-acid ligase II
VVLPDETRRLDPASVWKTVEQKECDQITMVGDAFARPLLEELRKGSYDASRIRVVMSTAAVLSPAVKQELAALLPPGTLFIESVGGSEMGLQAMSFDTTSERPGLPAYDLRPGTVILKADRSGVLDPATARRGEGGDIGWIASTGHLPLGYLGDAERTRATFPMIGGVRYVVGGDRAYYGSDGRVIFLGRESSCINTGGEKVYVEEVERIVKSHPAVYDAVVVGVPSVRWGEAVTAVVSLRAGQAAPAVDALRAHCEAQLARYKLPQALVVAPEIVRSPSGKPDYAWARAYAGQRVTPA